MSEEALKLAEALIGAEHNSGSEAIAALQTSMEVLAPIVGRPALFNILDAQAGKKEIYLSLMSGSTHPIRPS